MKKLLIPGIGAASIYFLYPTSIDEPTTQPYLELPKAEYTTHPNQHFLDRVPQTIGIVGGGIGGAITAKTLSQQGYKVQVFDRNPGPGGLWHSNYDGSGLQFPYPHYNLPDYEFPEGTDTLPKQDKVREFTASYMDHFQISRNFQFNTNVTGVSQGKDGKWTVSLSNKKSHTFDFLVLCTGPFNKPFVPQVPQVEQFKGAILHSSEFKNAESLCRDKKVVIVGSRKSALDIAGEAHKYGGNCSLMIRRPHWLLPSNFTILGVPLSFFVSTRFANLFLYPFYDDQDNYFFRKFQFLIKPYWNFVTGRLVKGLPDILVPNTEYHREKHYIGGARNMDVYEMIKDGTIPVYKGNIERFTENGIVISGQEVQADTVVFATGFQRDLFQIGDTAEGMWLYRNTLNPEIRNFAIVGIINTYCNPMHTNMQAVWLSEVLRGRVKLPSVEGMKKDISLRKEYCLKIIKEGGVASFSWFPYPTVDQFLNDMQLPTNRKSNRFCYWTEPIKPSDYKLVVTHRV